MTDPTTTLANALPADPADDGPIGIPDSAALRQLLADNVELRAAAKTILAGDSFDEYCHDPLCDDHPHKSHTAEDAPRFHEGGIVPKPTEDGGG